MQIPLKPLCMIATAAGVAAAAIPARLKDPIGVHAIVERVVMSPTHGAPNTIRIYGVFAVGAPHPRIPGAITYHIGRGYVYYRVNDADPSVSRAEWQMIGQAAGSGRVIAYGARGGKNGSLRVPYSPESDPDPYPLGLGFSHPQAGSIVDRLVHATAPVSPPPNDTVDAKSVRLVAWPAVVPGQTYTFELSGAGTVVASDAVTPSSGELTWVPGLQLKRGVTYTWRVWPTTTRRPARGWAFHAR